MFVDLTGKTFDRLTVIERVGKDHTNSALWRCKCVCGNEKIVATNSLKACRVKSCGCARKGNRGVSFTLEYVKKEALKLGRWKIVDTVYNGSSVKLKCVCLKCNAKAKLTWDNIKQNKGCRNCNRIAYTPNRTIKEIREVFEKEGYTLLSEKYTGCKQKLKYRCPKGHTHSITISNWESNKRRCPYCAGRAKLSQSYVNALFEKEGYTVISEYKNTMTSIKYRCPVGHTHSVKIDDWRRGDRCPYCSPGKVKRKLTTKIVRAELEKEGYTLLSEYKNSRTKFLYKCKNGHFNNMTYNCWYGGHRCPDCVSNHTSKFEKAVKKYVNNLNISFVPNDRTVILNSKTGKYLELDLWFPQLNKAIECDGFYWHQDQQSMFRDGVKTKRCKQLGISLFRIDYRKWTNKQEKCKRHIVSFLKGEEMSNEC